MSLDEVCLVVRQIYKDFILPSGGAKAAPIGIVSDVVPAVGTIMRSGGKPYDIELCYRSWSTFTLQAMLLRYETRAKIYYSSTPNLCKRRFLVAKELIHLLIDNEDAHYTKDVVALGSSLLTKAPVNGCSSNFLSEQLAVAGAVELLFPWHLRGEMRAMADNGISDLKIATLFRAPEIYVFSLLHTPYGDLSARANED